MCKIAAVTYIPLALIMFSEYPRVAILVAGIGILCIAREIGLVINKK